MPGVRGITSRVSARDQPEAGGLLGPALRRREASERRPEPRASAGRPGACALPAARAARARDDLEGSVHARRAPPGSTMGALGNRGALRLRCLLSALKPEIYGPFARPAATFG